jgi:RNase P subunit RPR2
MSIQTVPSLSRGHLGAAPAPSISPRSSTEWRCTKCFKLLGICQNDRVHLRFAREHEYLVSLPVAATCRDCGTLNEIRGACAPKTDRATSQC